MKDYKYCQCENCIYGHADDTKKYSFDRWKCEATMGGHNRLGAYLGNCKDYTPRSSEAEEIIQK